MTARPSWPDPRATGNEHEEVEAETAALIDADGGEGGASEGENDEQKRRQDRRELVLSAGVLFIFVWVVLVLRLKHTPWDDVSGAMIGLLGLAKRGPAWSAVDRIGLFVLLAVSLAIETVWAMAAIWLDKRVFRPYCRCVPGRSRPGPRTSRYKKEGEARPSDFGTTVGFAAFPLILSWTFSAVYAASTVRAWCYVFYALTVGAAALMNFSSSLVCCDFKLFDLSLLFPTLPRYTARYYREK